LDAFSGDQQRGFIKPSHLEDFPMKIANRQILAFIVSAITVTSAYGKDQARDGARLINDEYQYFVNSLPVADNDYDAMLAKELCGFQIFTEWGGQYMSIIKSTPNLEISDIQPVTDLIVRLEKIQDGFNEAKSIFPDHYRQFRTGLLTMRSQGTLAAEASQQGLTLADAKKDQLRIAFSQCQDDNFVNNAIFRVQASFWGETISYSSARPGTIGVTWGVSGSGTPSYVVTPGEIVVSSSKRSSFLRKALMW
jgi:hypothetical protein